MENQTSNLNIEFVLVLGTSGMLLLTAAIVIFIYLYQRKLIKKKLEYQQIEDLLKKQELKTAYAMLEGQEKAQRRIAQELHDNLGSILVTLNMYADTLQKKPDPKNTQQLADKISKVAQSANEDIRKISHSLHSGMLQHFGLASAIKELVEAVNTSHNLEVTSQIHIENQISTEISLNIYRITQELVNNILKHAQATRVNIEVTQAKDHLSLICEDNGAGFNPHEKRNGIGLKNIRSRVDDMEGTLTIDSGKDNGTTTIIEIPLP